MGRTVGQEKMGKQGKHGIDLGDNLKIEQIGPGDYKQDPGQGERRGSNETVELK